jgi:hypothetical protein
LRAGVGTSRFRRPLRFVAWRSGSVASRICAEVLVLVKEAGKAELERAEQARAAVARVWPELLDTSGIDTTLSALALSRTVLERLEQGYRFELAKEWLRGLPRLEPSEDR